MQSKIIKFPGVYLIKAPNGEKSDYNIAPFQGLHRSAIATELSKGGAIEFLIADLSYNTQERKYTIEKMEVCEKPTSSKMLAVMTNVSTILRTEGLYRAEYGATGPTFSQMNN